MIEDLEQEVRWVGSWQRRPGPGIASSRRLVRTLLADQQDKIYKAQLVVTELVTNAYRHGLGLTDGAIQIMDTFPEDVVLRLVDITRGRSCYLRIEVYDPNPTQPDWDRSLDDKSAVRGRGLAMIRSSLSRYGAISTKNGKCVVAEYELDHSIS